MVKKFILTFEERIPKHEVIRFNEEYSSEAKAVARMNELYNLHYRYIEVEADGGCIEEREGEWEKFCYMADNEDCSLSVSLEVSEVKGIADLKGSFLDMRDEIEKKIADIVRENGGFLSLAVDKQHDLIPCYIYDEGTEETREYRCCALAVFNNNLCVYPSSLNDEHNYTADELEDADGWYGVLGGFVLSLSTLGELLDYLDQHIDYDEPLDRLTF